MSDLDREVERIADDVLFEHALEVDASGEIPRSHFDVLAAAGLYGIAGPADAGGLDLDALHQRRVREVLAGGCLTTTFVWAQHHGAVRCVRDAAQPIRDAWLPALCSGRVRAGLALAGLKPGASSLRIARTAGGWTLDGSSPLVTGWGYLGVLLVAARVDADVVAFALVDTARPGLHAQPRRLAALDATRTVALRFDGVALRDEDVVQTTALPAWAAEGEGVRINGTLAIGVAQRCARISGVAALHADVAAARLVAERGASALDLREHAQRLAREAIFLLAFGQRPAIKLALLRGLT